MKIQDREFYFEIASDVIRDGIGVMLWEKTTEEEVYVAELFRNDKKKQIEFTARADSIPYEVLQELLKVFHEEIPKEYQD